MRGLARDPAARWSSMDELLAALSRSTSSRRRWWALGVLAIGGALVGSWALGRDDEVCSGGASRLAEVWTPEQSESLAAAIRSTGVSYADEMARIVPTELGHYAEAWAAAYEDACRATHVLGEQSETLLDLRMSCLDRRLVALDAMVDVLAEPNATTVQEASTAVASPPSLDACADRETLLAAVAPPDDPSTAAVVEDARAALARADALREAGRYDDAADAAAKVIDQLESVDYRPAVAEALLSLGDAEAERAEYDASIAALERGYRLAIASGHDVVAARIAIVLIYVEGYRRNRTERALLWAQHADALVERVGSEAELASYAIANRATVLASQGKLREARDLFEEALELRASKRGDDDADVWLLRGNLAVMSSMLGDDDAALSLHEQVVAADERRLGATHPKTAKSIFNYATALTKAERYDRARSLYQRALAIYEAAHGPDHPVIVDVLSNLGASYFNDGDADAAAPYWQRALEISQKHGDQVSMAASLGHLANLARERGQSEEAVRMYLEALEIQRRLMGHHPFVAVTLLNLAEVALEAERFTEAADWATQAVAVYEESLGRDHPDLYPALFDLGVSRLRTGDARGAQAPLERALALATDDAPLRRAAASLELAEVLWILGEDRERARELGEAALRLYEAQEDPDAAKARSWLREREREP